MTAAEKELETVWWEHDAVGYVDQRLLPGELRHCRAEDAEAIAEAIATLAVRGAPAIGIFGAYGVALARTQHADDAGFRAAAAQIRSARPTAVNLAWAVDRTLAASDPLAAARAIHEEQRAIDRRIAGAASALFPARCNVLTHCNTGALATAGEGTALGAIIAASRAGKKVHAYVGETRPLLQGARLTLYELAQAGVPATLLIDAAAAITLQRKAIALVIVGADRIAANGDVANKIGTYGLALAAANHGVPFYVAAPRSTFDLALEDGSQIPIEERADAELRTFAGGSVAEQSEVYNPAFDVTPGHLVTAFATEYGIMRPPYHESLPSLATRPAIAALP